MFRITPRKEIRVSLTPCISRYFSNGYFFPFFITYLYLAGVPFYARHISLTYQNVLLIPKCNMRIGCFDTTYVSVILF